MSFATFADGTANLPASLLDGITVLPCEYTIDNKPGTYDGNLESFDAHNYYTMLKSGVRVRTSLLNTQFLMDHFRSVLEAGRDLIYTCMSSGISGTYQAAKLAATELMEEFPERFVHIVDSRTCGLGIGMLSVESADLSKRGIDVRKAATILDDMVEHCCSYFTVDDLNFLKSTGRVSGATAMIGTVLNIKPVLYGSSDGQILATSKVRGRKKSIEALAEAYRKKAISPDERTVFISHGDCIEDAKKLAEMISEIVRPQKLVICPHEPFSGAHVGPGMLALFFYGTER